MFNSESSSMRSVIRRLLLRLAARFGTDTEKFEEGLAGVPDSDNRAVMSPLKLAQILSTSTPGSTAYILIEHELQLKIAGVQANATRSAGWLRFWGTLVAAAIAFFLGYFIGPSPTKVSNNAEGEKATASHNAGLNDGSPEGIKPTPASPVFPPKASVKVPLGASTQQASGSSRGKP